MLIRSVVCDHCGAENDMSLRVEKMADTVNRHFLQCPACKREFTSHYTNDAVLELQFKIQEEYARIRRCANQTIADLADKKIKRMKAEMAAIMDALKTWGGKIPDAANEGRKRHT